MRTAEWNDDAEQRFALKITSLWRTLTPEQVAEFLVAVRRFWPQTAIDALGEHFRESSRFPTPVAIQDICRDRISAAIKRRDTLNDSRAQLIDAIETHKNTIIVGESGARYRVGIGGLYRLDNQAGQELEYELLIPWDGLPGGSSPFSADRLEGIMRQLSAKTEAAKK